MTEKEEPDRYSITNLTYHEVLVAGEQDVELDRVRAALCNTTHRVTSTQQQEGEEELARREVCF